MSGRQRVYVVLTALLLAVAAAFAVPAVTGWSGTVRPGDLIEGTDYTSATIYLRGPLVGDVVMFEIDMPTIADGKSIEITDLVLSRSTPGIRLEGGRIYERNDFGGFAIAVWHSKSGDSDDPRLRPSKDLVGSTLEGEHNPERFILFEFTVCAAGDLGVDAIDVTYQADSTKYRQTLRVDFDVREALPGIPCT